MNELAYKDMFDLAPVSLWLEDFSQVHALMSQWRSEGVTDLRSYLNQDVSRAAQCARAIKVVSVNRRTLELFGAADQQTLVDNLHLIFRGDMHLQQVEELVQIWDGKTQFSTEAVNYTLDGRRLDLLLNAQALPNHERTWTHAIISLEDITQRKREQVRLEYLSTFDVHTGVRNRAYYQTYCSVLERQGQRPISVIVVDLNGLKSINDAHGHALGDQILCRAAGILMQVAREPDSVMRIGGDEFIVLLVGANAANLEARVQEIHALAHAHNMANADVTLSFSIGAVTCGPGALLESAIKQADGLMYAAKRRHYSRHERRTGA